MNISAVFSGFLRIPHYFMIGRDFSGINLSHHKINVSSNKTFYFQSGSFSQFADAIIYFDFFSAILLKKAAAGTERTPSPVAAVILLIVFSPQYFSGQHP